MKGRIYLKGTPHKFEKQNLVSLKDGSDIYVCSLCKINGKRPAFADYVNVSKGRKGIFHNCIKKKNGAHRPIKIQLTRDIPVVSKNLKSGTIHTTIAPPPEQAHIKEGVWVNGDVEPTRILPNEYVQV